MFNFLTDGTSKNTKETITPELPESNEVSLDEIISNYETNSQN